jgi:hypothetical protein
VLLMELISTNYLGVLVTELRDIVGGARYGHFESKVVGVTKVLPKRYFFGVVVPVVVWVTYSILRVMLQRASVDVANTDYLCEVLGKEAFWYQSSFEGTCQNDASNLALYVKALAATVPAVQLFTPVLAAILLMMLVVEVHALEIEAAVEQLRTTAATAEDDFSQERVAGAVRIERALQPFLKVKASLASTSKHWSSVLATEILLLLLLICEPLVVAHTGNAASEYLLLSNVMAAVATPFVLLLAVGAWAIVRLNERAVDVPRVLTREQLFTLVERNAFCDEYQRIDLGLQVFGASLTKARIAVAFSSLGASLLVKLIVQQTASAN